MDVIRCEGLIGKLPGKGFLVTGCSSGLGVETARALHETGADFCVTVRNVAKAQTVVDDNIRKNSGGRGKLEVLKLELDSLESVWAYAGEFLRRSDVLNVLVCNAGVMAAPEGRTQDGFETHFGVNQLGHHLLFQLPKPALLRALTPELHSRVVCVFAAGHMWGDLRLDDLDLNLRRHNPRVAYAASEIATIHMALETERRYGTQGLHAA